MPHHGVTRQYQPADGQHSQYSGNRPRFAHEAMPDPRSGQTGKMRPMSIPSSPSISAADRIAPSRGIGKPAAARSFAPARNCVNCLRAWRKAAALACHAVARADPTQPTAIPRSVKRWSALSARNKSRYSARDVNIRYGSGAPLVTRSSIITPI